MRRRVTTAIIALLTLAACASPETPASSPSPVATPSSTGVAAGTPAPLTPDEDVRPAAGRTLAGGPLEMVLELVIDGEGGVSTSTTRGRFAGDGTASFAVALGLPGADQELTVERSGGTAWFRWLGAQLRLPGGASWISAPVGVDTTVLSARDAEVGYAAAHAVVRPRSLLELVEREAGEAAEPAGAVSLCCDFHDDLGPTMALAVEQHTVVLTDRGVRDPLLRIVPPVVETALRNGSDARLPATVAVDDEGRVRRLETVLIREDLEVRVRLDVLREVDDVGASPPPAEETITADDAAGLSSDA